MDGEVLGVVDGNFTAVNSGDGAAPWKEKAAAASVDVLTPQELDPLADQLARVCSRCRCDVLAFEVATRLQGCSMP